MDAEFPENWARPVIPCFFITNRSMQDRSEQELDTLANRMIRKADAMIAALPTIEIPEWQLDCDWTSTTQGAFFGLIERIRNRLHARGTQLSVTIRLHQVKYADRTGIPPADRGMLMFYNMDNVSDPETQNSILDLEVARTYMASLSDYALPLDVALPVFEWAVWLRDGRILGLFHPFDRQIISDTSKLIPSGSNSYELLESTYLDGRYVYAGDQLRLEGVAGDSLAKALRLLHNELGKYDRRLALYALNRNTSNAFPYEDLAQILATWE